MSPACPDLQELRRGLLGPASRAEVEQLARHLEVCGQCGECLDQMLDHDALVEALRQSSPATPEIEADVVQGLIARLQALRKRAKLFP